MKTFKDLEFKQHPHKDGIVARMFFENGFGVSVVRHAYSYGGDKGLFELAVLDDSGEIHYDNPVANGDVIGYLRPEDVTDVMERVEKL